MIKPYMPTKDELIIAGYKKELYRKEHVSLEEAVEQEDIIIALIHAIRVFDYYYSYSDSASTWRNGEERAALISQRIADVSDVNIRHHLSSHFNSDKCRAVGSIFDWPQYLYKITPYHHLLWEGFPHEKACWLLGLKTWVERLNAQAKDAGSYGRVVYTNNLAKATELLSTENNWFDHTGSLKAVSVSNQFHKELTKFAKLYQRGVIRFTDLRTLFNHNAEISFVAQAEMLKLVNIYMLFID